MTVEERSTLIDELSSEDFTKRTEASQALVNEAETNLQEVLQQVLEVMRSSSNPEVDRQTKEVIRAMYRRHKLGIGDVDCGWKLGWFLDHNGKNLSSMPMVLEVVEGGPADKAGLVPGDVITHLGRESLRSKHSRNEFVEKVAKKRPGEKLNLKVRFSGAKGAFEIYNKHKKKNCVVVPVVRPPGGQLEAVDNADVKRWIAEVTGEPS